ncbi:MAG: hypothetical protein COV72_04510 [Candidatus Omnitrophica bacterium CG11_big_fil_rev_8_21_14_0_20_42_13]|uniref:DUF1805 domain-containing protein n=1 Tax=Candidatus Ghiorseimicrobium undicola TaxID=1974746 RepID=A0A2H0LXJ9_9BACT|nr:MAG: hypothetical protein COV72_04510 [Candidatus Omnitrophica bacterium CG11_big_fil_rev_8_21_14_0_20_42_13]
MQHIKVKLARKEADGYVIALGPVNLVSVVTDVGMLACGAFNALALDKFNYPCGCVSSPNGKPVANIDDLLESAVMEANNSAQRLGIRIGMNAREALDKM